MGNEILFLLLPLLPSLLSGSWVGLVELLLLRQLIFFNVKLLDSFQYVFIFFLYLRICFLCMSDHGQLPTSCHPHNEPGQAPRVLGDAPRVLLAAGRWAVTHRASPWEKGIGSASWCLREKEGKCKAPRDLLATPRPALDILPASPHPPLPPLPPSLTPWEIWSVPVRACVEGSSHFRCSQGILFPLFPRVLRDTCCIWYLLLERRATVMVTALLSTPSLFYQSEGHVYEVWAWRWKWEQFGFITCGIDQASLMLSAGDPTENSAWQLEGLPFVMKGRQVAGLARRPHALCTGLEWLSAFTEVAGQGPPENRTALQKKSGSTGWRAGVLTWGGGSPVSAQAQTCLLQVDAPHVGAPHVGWLLPRDRQERDGERKNSSIFTFSIPSHPQDLIYWMATFIPIFSLLIMLPSGEGAGFSRKFFCQVMIPQSSESRTRNVRVPSTSLLKRKPGPWRVCFEDRTKSKLKSEFVYLFEV